jgi:hypothetical protein
MAEPRAVTTVSRLVWPGLVLAPLAWAAHGLLGWFIAARACADGDAAWGVVPPGGVRLLLGLLAVAALAVAFAGASAGASRWRQLSTRPRLEAAYGRDSREFLAIAALFVSIGFGVGIVLNGLPAVLVGACVFTR